MKILVAILTCESSQNRADACYKSWIQDIQEPHSYYFYGSKNQSEKISRTWNCEPNDGEARFRLPEKTYKMLVKSLNYDWDFLFKCDDDTYVNFNKLVEFLKDYDANDDLYLGSKIAKPIAYAQGGAGYVLTRTAVKCCIESLKHFYKLAKARDAEDYSVGLALKEQGVNLTHTNLLSTIDDPNAAEQNQSECVDAIIKHGKITTHYVNPETMKTIHRAFRA